MASPTILQNNFHMEFTKHKLESLFRFQGRDFLIFLL